MADAQSGGPNSAHDQLNAPTEALILAVPVPIDPSDTAPLEDTGQESTELSAQEVVALKKARLILAKLLQEGAKPLPPPADAEVTTSVSWLHERVLDPALIRQPATAKPIEATIVSDHTIVLDDHELAFDRNQLFLFNALMLLRDRPRTADELQALGFGVRGTIGQIQESFEHPMGRLSRVLNYAAGTDVIKKEDDRYSVIPELTLIDARSRESANPGNDTAARTSLPADMEVSRKLEKAARDDAITQLVITYRTHRQVTKSLKSYRLSNRSIPYNEDSNRMYMNQLDTYRLLTAEDEVRLFELIEKGWRAYKVSGGIDRATPEQEQAFIDLVWAHEAVYLCNLKLVVTVARQFNNSGIPSLDLVQEGNRGLATAILRFDERKGFKFSTYATWWIEQTIKRSRPHQMRSLRLPADKFDIWVDMTHKIVQLERELRRYPTTEEIAEKLEITPALVESIQLAMRPMTSLSGPMNENGDVQLADLLPDEHDIDTETEQNYDHDRLIEAFKQASLNKQQQMVLGLYFPVLFHPELEELVLELRDGSTVAFVDVFEEALAADGLTLTQIGAHLKVTMERIRRVKEVALEKLNRILQEDER